MTFQVLRDREVIRTAFDLSFLRNLGETKSSGCILSCSGLMAGVGAGCCILRNARIDLTSASYELSAIVFPLDASLHAAIQRAYCASCREKS